MPEGSVPEELRVAREELAEAEAVAARRAAKPRIRAHVWNLDELPRVDLHAVLNAYDPVSVGNEQGHEYIVVAPKGTMFQDEPGERQLALQDFGIPPERGPKRTGVGSETGALRAHPRVSFEQGIGVAGEGDLTSELGTAVASPWTAWTRREYNSDLIGYKGLRVYQKMKKNDGTVRGALRLAKTPVLSAQWGIKPASDNIRDKNIADFIWKNLTRWQSTSFPQFLTEALLMVDYGYYMFEKVFARGEDVTPDPIAKGKIVWKKLAPRHPMDVKEWYMDLNGGPLSVDMWAPPVQITDTTLSGVGLRNPIPQTFEGGIIQAFQRWVNIPIDKLIVFSFDKEAGDIEGVSILRSAYKHWYYKDNLYKIDCLDEETRGLTPFGWKSYDQLQEGDLLLTVNTDTGLTEWQPIKKMNVHSGAVYDMIKMESRVFSALTTPDHRWWVQNRRSGSWKWKTTETLSYLDNIPLGMPHSNFPTEDQRKYTDEFVELVAWIYTEGSVHGQEGTYGSQKPFGINQSHIANPQKCAEIRRALLALGTERGFAQGSGDWSENVPASAATPDMTRFSLGAKLSREFWKVFSRHKVVKPEFILSLTKAQLQLFVNVSVAGDGYDSAAHPETQQSSWHEAYVAQEDKEQLFAFQLACTLLGIPTTCRHYGKGYKHTLPSGHVVESAKGAWRCQMQRLKFICPLRAANGSKRVGYKNGMTIEKVQHKGTIWCPTVQNSNFLAERSGRTFFTANSIQKERHGIGVPVIQLPMGYSEKDKARADQLGRNLRTNERAHVVLPPNWTLTFAELKTHPVDCMTSIKHHDDMILQSMLGSFLNRQTTGAGAEEQHTIFLKATRFTADIVLDVLNQYAIPQLVRMNWGRTVYPTLYAKRIGEQEDWRTQSFTIRNYVGAGVIVPDQALEDQLRDEMGLPPADMETARMVRESPMQNEQRINPAATQLPGPGHQVLPNNQPGQPRTPNQPPPPQPAPGTSPLGPVGFPTGQGGQPISEASVKKTGYVQPPKAGTLKPRPPKPPRVGLPRQRPRGIVSPGVGKGDRSGKSGRRGQ